MLPLCGCSDSGLAPCPHTDTVCVPNLDCLELGVSLHTSRLCQFMPNKNFAPNPHGIADPS